MIYGNINDFNQITLLKNNSDFKGIFDLIKNKEINIKDDEVIYLNDHIRYFVSKLNTKDNNKFEAHKKHLDFFYLLEGKENIYVSNTSNLNIIEDYDDQKDIMFGESDNYSIITLNKGDFIILFPEDSHAPGNGNNDYIERLVFKIKISD